MNKSHSILSVICLLVLLSACSLPFGNKVEESTITPTLPPDAAAYTQSAETIIAQITQAIAGTPTPAASTEATAEQAVNSTSTSSGAESPSPTGPTPASSTTAFPSPTFIPSITPSPTWIPDDPRNDFGEPDWSANFNEKFTWYTFDEPTASIWMENGELLLSAKNSDIFDIWSLSWPNIDDFYLEYTFVVGERCIGEDRYGIVFRAPDPQSGYLFGVNCKGEFDLRYWDGKDFSEIVAWTASEYINIGGGAANRLGVRAEGESLSLYINGHQVNKIKDSSSSEGKFGAFIKAELIDGFNARILEVTYWDLP